MYINVTILQKLCVPAYDQLVNQYAEVESDGPLNICIVKVPNTQQIVSQVCCADTEQKGLQMRGGK